MPDEPLTTAPAPTPTPAPEPTTPSPTSTPEPSFASGAEPAAAEPAGAPDTYAEFTAAEGHTIDKATIEAATPIFKELNLTQEQAQKLVSLQANRDAQVLKAGREAYENTRTEWREGLKAEFGTRLPEVSAEIGKAMSALPEDARGPFRDIMNQTGIGDNPAFVKAFYSLAKLVNEGKHIAPGGPAPQPGSRPTTMAGALYPNLPQ